MGWGGRLYNRKVAMKADGPPDHPPLLHGALPSAPCHNNTVNTDKQPSQDGDVEVPEQIRGGARQRQRKTALAPCLLARCQASSQSGCKLSALEQVQASSAASDLPIDCGRKLLAA